MTRAPYRLIAPIGTRATLGMVVLQTDETIEHDFRRLCAAPDIAIHVSRIPVSAELTPDSIRGMDADLARAAALLPEAAPFDSVAYACTSGTAQIGPARVARHLRTATGAPATTDPMSAAIAGLRALGISRIGLVSPYIPGVAEPLRRGFEAAGITVGVTCSFGECMEANVARIDPASILDAALQAGRDAGIEAVFLSCTNLRTLDILDAAEDALGKPVLSSNQALAWHMLAQAGLTAAPANIEPGLLLRRFPAPVEASPMIPAPDDPCPRMMPPN